MKKYPITPILTIDQAILEMDEIIKWSKINNSRVGYFAVLYQMVTKRIQSGIANGDFQDNERMELLDVIFATRYINAWKQWINKEELSDSWKIAFDATKNNSTLVIQQMLLGINAHINLDLGIATKETMNDKPSIEPILADFDLINSILDSMIDSVKQNLQKVSPLIWLAMKVGKGNEDLLANFSISLARSGAWHFGSKLSYYTSYQSELIKRQDNAIAKLASNLAKPEHKMLKNILWFASKFEYKQPREIIEQLQPIVQNSYNENLKKEFKTI